MNAVGLLLVSLVVLKILGFVQMNWFLVLTSWIWMPIAILMCALVLAAIVILFFITVAAVLGR